MSETARRPGARRANAPLTGSPRLAAIAALSAAALVGGVLAGGAAPLAEAVAASPAARAVLARLLAIEAPWWLFVAPAALIFALERSFPAEPNRPLWSPETAQDAAWFALEIALRATAYFFLGEALAWAHRRWLGGIALTATLDWPVALRALLGIAVYDFVLYWHHVMHHRAAWLWPFHAVHHSQRHLSLFTVARFHVVEKVLARGLIFLPLTLLGLTQTETLVTAWLVAWHPRLYHANVRASLGPLRYLIVTPQSHRVHHSLARGHRDRNYATHFPVWDMLFGTQQRGRDDYPVTGVDDPAFPLETGGWRLLTTPVAQLAYPFRQVFARFRAGDRALC